MNTDPLRRSLKAYPRRWREVNAHVLFGMLEEARDAHPELVPLEARTAARKGLAMRITQVLPWVLGAISVASAAVAMTIVAVAFTEQNEALVHVLCFFITPLASLWAIVVGLISRPTTVHPRWGAAVLGSLGILVAGGAHVLWYLGVDTDMTNLPPIWGATTATAFVLIGIALTISLFPAFARATSRTVAVIATALVAASGAITTIVFLSLPFSAPIIAQTAVVIVLTIRPGRQCTALNPPAAPSERQRP